MEWNNYNSPQGDGKGHDYHGKGHGKGHEHHCHIPCFTKNTNILTKKGLKPVQHLKVDDLVLTRDNGFKSVSWVGKKTISKNKLHNKILPYLVNNTLYSPNHRILKLVDSSEREVFDYAKNIGKVTLVDNVTYFHFTLDKHEVVFSGEEWTESFYVSDYSLTLLDIDARNELLMLFPEKFTELVRKVA